MSEWIHRAPRKMLENPETGFRIHWIYPSEYHGEPFRFTMVKEGFGFGFEVESFPGLLESKEGPFKAVINMAGGIMWEPPRMSDNRDWTKLASGRKFASIEQQNTYLAALHDAVPHIPFGNKRLGLRFGCTVEFTAELSQRFERGEFVA